MFAIILLGLAILGAAQPAPPAPSVTVTTIDITEPSLPKLKVDQPISQIALPPLHGLNITSSKTSKSPDSVGSADYTITTRECIPSLHQPISEDCESLCSHIGQLQGPLLLHPLTAETFETGGCAFGVGNLDPCEDVSIDPISMLNEFCTPMYQDCALNGYDAYIEITDPHLGFAMSGEEAAPPYGSPSC
jgi:hypothetical protein